MSSFLIILLMWQWQPMLELIWEVSSLPIQIFLWTLSAVGWLLVAVSPRLINDKHFFGLQQVRQQLHDQPLTSPEFQTPGVYCFVRHPIMVGFFLAFWATPRMSIGHLIFSIATTIYILIALRYEERDLIRYFGDRYRNYQRRVRMFVPVRRGKTPVTSEVFQTGRSHRRRRRIMDTWFVDITDNSLDPRVPDNHCVIEENIKNSIDVFEDEDGDGEDD